MENILTQYPIPEEVSTRLRQQTVRLLRSVGRPAPFFEPRGSGFDEKKRSFVGMAK